MLQYRYTSYMSKFPEYVYYIGSNIDIFPINQTLTQVWYATCIILIYSEW